jgi:membrane complex biogenesis BtpA family protein
MHDAPYLRGGVGPEIVASMTCVGLAVREATGDTPIGLQVLAAANCEAIAIAQAIGARFVRVENFVYSHVADEGLMAEASAGPLLRFRKRIGAEDITIFADIKKKHAAHAMTGDVSLAEMASAAAFSGADGVIVTGASTGAATSLTDIRAAKSGSHLPVLVGSGANTDTIQALLQHADGVIVGSALKVGGKWANEMDYDAVKRLAKSVRKGD